MPRARHVVKSVIALFAIWALIMWLSISGDRAFLYVLGIRFYGPTSQWYNFWSGFGSDLGEASILTGLIVVFRHHNCHVHRCWRVRTHEVDGTPFKACHKHHPEITVDREQVTPGYIREQWLAARRFK